MHGLGGELALDDDVGFPKAFLHVAVLELNAERNVALHLGIVPPLQKSEGRPCGHVFMQQGRVGPHRVAESEHRGQHVVFDVDQAERLLGDVGAGRSDRGHGVALIEDLRPREDVLGKHPRVAPNLGEVNGPVGKNGKVGRGGHGFDVRVRFRPARVDAADAGVRVRAPQDLAVQETGHVHVGAVAGSAGDLLHAVVPDGPRAQDPKAGVCLAGGSNVGSHDCVLSTVGRVIACAGQDSRGPRRPTV